MKETHNVEWDAGEKQVKQLINSIINCVLEGGCNKTSLRRDSIQHIKIGSNSYQKVKTFKYLGSLLINQNSIQEEIK